MLVFKSCARSFLYFTKRKHMKNYEKCFFKHKKRWFRDTQLVLLPSSPFPLSAIAEFTRAND